MIHLRHLPATPCLQAAQCRLRNNVIRAVRRTPLSPRKTFTNPARTIHSAGLHAFQRTFSTHAEAAATPASSSLPAKSIGNGDTIYTGALSKTFRNLKLFSLSSLSLATALTPFMFIIESSLPFSGRVILATTAMLTSGVSTGLVSWCGAPYVTSARRVKVDEADGTALQFETMTLFFRRRLTTVYDTSFLGDTKRPFARYELAKEVVLGEKDASREMAGREETIAETTDVAGNIVGRWIVQWDDKGSTGVCRPQGKVIRYFNTDDGFPPL